MKKSKLCQNPAVIQMYTTPNSHFVHNLFYYTWVNRPIKMKAITYFLENKHSVLYNDDYNMIFLDYIIGYRRVKNNHF